MNNKHLILTLKPTDTSHGKFWGPQKFDLGVDIESFHISSTGYLKYMIQFKGETIRTSFLTRVSTLTEINLPKGNLILLIDVRDSYIDPFDVYITTTKMEY